MTAIALLACMSAFVMAYALCIHRDVLRARGDVITSLAVALTEEAYRREDAERLVEIKDAQLRGHLRDMEHLRWIVRHETTSLDEIEMDAAAVVAEAMALLGDEVTE